MHDINEAQDQSLASPLTEKPATLETKAQGEGAILERIAEAKPDVLLDSLRELYSQL